MADNKPTHTIVHQGPIIATTDAYMTVKLVEHSDGNFGFSWLKSPFATWWNNDERFASKAKAETAVRLFVESTTKREPYLQVIFEGLDVEPR